MDSVVSLALMRKAQLVFGREGTFVSFPLTPLAYEGDDLRFMSGGLTTGQTVAFREFSEIVDRIPRGSLVDPTSDQYLSSEFTDTLLNGGVALAASTRTSAEEVRYQDALAVLYGPETEEGLLEDSTKLKTYKQYRDAWYSLHEQIKSSQIDAEHSANETAKRRWEEVEQPALERRLEDLERDWAAKGFRSEVERALEVHETLGCRTPDQLWGEWKGRCNPEIDRSTDPVTNQTFWPCGYSPSNAFETEGWFPFTLTGDSVESLSGEAPADLRGRLQDQVRLEIENLSFECTSLRVERSWFTSELFDSRFWKFEDASKVLSSGDSLAAGLCPSYIAAVVLARRIRITLKAGSQENQTALDRFRTSKVLQLGSLGFASRAATSSGSAAGTQLRVASPSLISTSLTAARGATPITVPAATMTRRAPTVAGRVRIMAPQPTMSGTAPTTTADAAVSRLSPVAMDKLRSVSFASLIRPRLALPTPTHPTTPSAPKEPDKSIQILAFVCRSLPRSPNPDPGLSWS